MGARFYITDVFATKMYSGNQLATVLHDDRIPDEEMQSIAAEFGFSETTFVMSQSPGEGGYPVRVFTPKAEIPFAGHPTLGTAHVLREHVLDDIGDTIRLRFEVGSIPVRSSDSGALWMQQNQPEFEDGADPQTIASMLGLNGDDMDPRWPISQVTTGLPFTIVPLRSADALRRAQVASSAYERWIDTVWAKGILAFHLSGRTQEQDITARVFVPYLGVPEDPATGSANGCLAGYILRHNVLGAADIDVRVGQGYEIARPSEILIRASLSENTYRIEVGGRVIDVASGLLNVTA